jgi:predicted Zn-dependent peptidase
MNISTKLTKQFMTSVTSLSLAVLLVPAAYAQTPPAPAPGRNVPQGAPQDPGTKETSISKVERKNRAPVSKDVLRVKLPKPVEAKLDNGMTALVMEDHRFPTVSVQFNIAGAGALYEPTEMAGLADVTAQMLREGTKTRTARQIAEEIDREGATLNASSGFGSSATTMFASGLSDNFDQWFSLATDVLLNPTFPADQVAKFKQRLKIGLRQQRAQPTFLANERFSRAVYGTYPAAIVSATDASIDAITPEALRRWHAERYAPQNTILGIAGDVKASELIPKLNAMLSAWKKTDAKEVLPPNPTPVTAKKIYLVDRPNSVQTNLVLGNIAIDRRDPDYIPFVVMNRIVGGGAAARLFINLRENKGYTYGAYSNFTALKYPGPWRATSEVRTPVTEGAMTEFFNEIRRIRDERVPQDELEASERSLVANFALSLESPEQLLGYAITQKIYGLPADYWDTYPAKILAVTADDVQRVARKYINPDNIQVVAVGDASKIKAVLEKFGPVEVYDLSGNVVMNKPQQ